MPDRTDGRGARPWGGWRREAPIGRARRPAFIRALVDDAAIAALVRSEHAEAGVSVEALRARVRAYAEEIVPQFDARLHHRVAHRLARRLATLLFRVRVGYVDDALRTGAPPDASVIFVCNHRSNLDYVLVAFLAAEQVAISFAVGEWARVWPLDSLIRGLGAFFVRRGSGDRLYRKVLERYVQLALEDGATQAIFPEGGLSRDGRLRPPRVGLLAYATRGFSPAGRRDLVFVPVGINYDRVLEDRTLLADLDVHAARRSRLATAALGVRWVAKNIGLYLRGRWFRFGYACVNFGPPFSLRRYLGARALDLARMSDAARAGAIEQLTQVVMEAVARQVPVTPVSLVAKALLESPGGAASRGALARRVQTLVAQLDAAGARLYVPRDDARYFLQVGLRMLTLRGLVADEYGVYRVVDAERHLLEYYANAIAHFFSPAAATHADVGETSATDAQPPLVRTVILVHGLARTRRSMARAGRALEEAGYDVYNWEYPSRHRTLAELTARLHDYARIVATSAGSLDFVTHSMGGLLVRGALALGLPHVGRVVMLAPPNRGARLAVRAQRHSWARRFFGPALRELGPDEQSRAHTDCDGPSCPVGVIAGTRRFHLLQPTSYYSACVRPAGSHDGTIGVEETHLDGMADFVTVDANHTFIADHDEAIRQTLCFLAAGRFDRRGE